MYIKSSLIKQYARYFKSNQEHVIHGSTVVKKVKSTEQQNNLKGKNKKKLIKKCSNLYQINYIQKSFQSHVCNFFNIIGINENAIWHSDYNQSYFKTLFYLKNVRSIQNKERLLLLQLDDCILNFPPIQYSINRFKSFGDTRFYRLAQALQTTAKKLSFVTSNSIISADQQKINRQIEDYIESMGNRMYVCRLPANKMIISKSLLQLAEYDPQEFALETLKFKTPLHEAISAEKYFEVTTKYFENLQNLCDFMTEKIPIEKLLTDSTTNYTETFYTKFNKKIICKVQVGLVHPLITVFEIVQVVSVFEEYQPNIFFRTSLKDKVLAEKKRVRKEEIQSLRMLIKLPENLLPENQHKVTSICQLLNDQNQQ